MKTLLTLFLLPAICLAQLLPTETDQLQLIESNTATLSTAAYQDGMVLSNALLQKHPSDSLVLLTRVRFLDAYVRKSKCTPYLVLKDENLCADALNFYNTVAKTINYPRLAIAQGRVYYNYAVHQNKPEAAAKAKTYFNQAIASGQLSDYEIEGLNRYLIQL